MIPLSQITNSRLTRRDVAQIREMLAKDPCGGCGRTEKSYYWACPVCEHENEDIKEMDLIRFHQNGADITSYVDDSY